MASGEHAVEAGGARAVVARRGAGLRSFTVDGRHHVEPVADGEDPPMGAGGVLIPWPNRTAGALFSWHGRTRGLEVTEPARGHAIHGLVRHRDWDVVAHDAAALTLGVDVPGGDDEHAGGWPQPLRVETTYAVGPDGLTVTHAVTNAGDDDVPVGVGAHPYLRVGDVPSSDCVLTATTATVLDLDDAAVPRGPARPVTPEEDLSGGRRVGDLDLDTPFGTGGGAVHHDLRAPDGTGTRLWADVSCAWVQVFTPDSPFGRPGRAVAVEPMTCPPDALNSGTDLAVLAPGDTWTVRWGIAALAPPPGSTPPPGDGP